jgi:hypothetical protein
MSKKNFLNGLIAFVVGIIGAVQYHLSQLFSGLDNFFGNRGDARLIVYMCEHWYQALLGKANLLSPASFYPTKGTLAYSDLLLGYAIPYSILRGLGVSMFLSLEVVVIAVNVLSYVACLVLLHKILRLNFFASAVAAAFFAFNSPKFFQLGHLQLQFLLFLPLVLIFVLLFARQTGTISQTRAAVYLSLAGFFLHLQLLTAFYHAWFFVLWSFLFLALALVLPNTRGWLLGVGKKYWPALLVSSGIFLLGLIPFLFAYLPTLGTGNWYSYANVSEMIPEWWSFLSMGDGNYVWGWLTTAVRPEPWPTYWGELMVGIGLIPSLAWVLITVWASLLIKRHRRLTDSKVVAGSRATAPIFLPVLILTTSLFFLIGLKLSGSHSAWYFVYSSFPGAGAIRAVSRYVIFLTLPMSIGFAYALNAAMKRIAGWNSNRARVAAAFVLVLSACFGLIEQFGVVKTGATGFSKQTEMKYLNAMAAKLQPDCAAFYVTAKRNDPHNAFEFQFDAMLISAIRRIPTLNGSSGQFPKDWFGLYAVKDPAYENNVRQWIQKHNIKGKICRLELSPPVEAFDGSNPDITDADSLFVRQHYDQFFGRDPTAEENNRWVRRLRECQTGACSRSDVSAELLETSGFQGRGSFIVRLYEVALVRMPRYEEFNSDMSRLISLSGASVSDWEAKQKFVDEFIKRPDFAARYQAVSESEFPLKLAQDLGIKTSPPSSNGADDYAKILLRVVESKEVSAKLSNRAFVAVHYFGYLQREPDPPGLESWLQVLKKTGNPKDVTAGFVNSDEYRQTF